MNKVEVDTVFIDYIIYIHYITNYTEWFTCTHAQLTLAVAHYTLAFRAWMY